MNSFLLSNIGELTTNVRVDADACGTIRDAAVLVLFSGPDEGTPGKIDYPEARDCFFCSLRWARKKSQASTPP